MIADAGKAAAILFVALIVQASILNDVDILHGRPKLLLVTVISLALLRKPTTQQTGRIGSLLMNPGGPGESESGKPGPCLGPRSRRDFRGGQ